MIFPGGTFKVARDAAGQLHILHCEYYHKDQYVWMPNGINGHVYKQEIQEFPGSEAIRWTDPKPTVVKFTPPHIVLETEKTENGCAT